MPIEKISFEESLKKTVIDNGLCTGCGACVVSCPYNCLDYDAGPKIISECKVCGICANVCPRYNVSITSLEQLIFGRERRLEEEFGVFKRVLVAQTRDENIMRVCQDGGVVTSILVSMLEDGVIQGSAISGKDVMNPLKATPVLALSKEDIIQCAGTRYTYSPNLLALRSGVQKKIGKMAFVGTPCQICAIRRIQALPLKKYVEALKFTIGLFCSESFVYDGLVKGLLQEKMGIKPEDVEKINIKGKFIIKIRDGQVKAVPLKEAKEYACRFCNACPDFSAELADISVGGLGLDGWTLTITRTDVGDEILRRVESKGIIKTKPLEDNKLMELLIRMSRKKREASMGKTT
ncbi:MAG: Coenzyme F420 hydrogenase/dehydrogenase, beta subunit C-terminal domain [Candidatus Bathyarchaeia archaeon]|nr:Coenzyme F420 hydrogenase/dehydrogenase, beta subunit C-terminal domain [Candidatus Bathyarchaeota archaeon]